ncbi:MAG: PadR family transcriptional regulator [Bacteroidales bacterium]|nr:PadR family transcriptional regulator [Bacteroidales bacterium]
MNIDNAKAQMRKGVLEYCILSILSRGDAYVSDIISQLKNSELIVVEGTLYPMLTRQKNAGLLSYRWEESTQGPPRKYYALTNEGRTMLQELDSSWKELVDAVESLKNTKSK